MNRVYKNVERIRLARGITKKKMAMDAGITQMKYQRISNGDTSITAELLESFASTLMVSNINVFFNDKLTDSVIFKKEDEGEEK